MHLSMKNLPVTPQFSTWQIVVSNLVLHYKMSPLNLNWDPRYTNR